MKTAILNVTNFVKKHDNIFAILLFFLATFGIVFSVNVTNSDEVWNFANLYKLYNGFEIYKDVNIIITPLFFYIGLIFFKILGSNILVFRLYHIIIMVSLYFTTYLLLKELKINKKIAIIIVLCFIIFEKYHLLTSQANYNTMALLFCVIGIYLYIKKCKYNWVIQGIILFLIFMTKQNIGVLYAIGLLVCTLLENNNLKEKIKKYIQELAVFMLFFMLMLFYFYKKNILIDFWNFAVLGIREFASKNVFIEISSMIIMIFFIIINIVLAVAFIKNKKVDKKQKKNILILESFSIPINLIAIPILNKMHFLLASYISVITFIYLISIMLKEIKFNNSKKIIKIILVIFSIFAISFSTYYFVEWLYLINNNPIVVDKHYKPFFGGIMLEDTKKSTDNVLNYVENNKNSVIILSPKAEIYAVLMNKNNGIFDLPLKGNLGKEGEKGLLEKIKNLHNTEILIEKSEDNMLWQESLIVREYIKKNMEKIGEIEEFDIYMKK